MTAGESDLALLARFRDDGDAEAFRQIVQRYAGAVFAACHRILRDPGSAEDAAQETFFRLMTRSQRINGSLGGWLHRVATRLALDIHRSDTARRRREAACAPQAPEASTWAEIAPQLDAAIAALPDESRCFLVRHFLNGESQADLAVEFRISAATLCRRMQDAVAALRQELERRGVAVAPMLLFRLMERNGVSAAPGALKLALRKMSLYCAARHGMLRPPKYAPVPVRAARAVFSFRWAIAGAVLALIVSMLLFGLSRRIPVAPSQSPVVIAAAPR